MDGEGEEEFVILIFYSQLDEITFARATTTAMPKITTMVVRAKCARASDKLPFNAS